MTSQDFTGVISERRFVPDAKIRWGVLHSKLEGKRVTYTVALQGQTRSLKANARYFSLIVPCVAEVLTQVLPEGSLPVSNDEAHEKLKEHFLGFVDTPLGRIPKRTRNLDTAAFADYCNRIEGWLMENFKVNPETMMDLT